MTWEHLRFFFRIFVFILPMVNARVDRTQWRVNYFFHAASEQIFSPFIQWWKSVHLDLDVAGPFLNVYFLGVFICICWSFLFPIIEGQFSFFFFFFQGTLGNCVQMSAFHFKRFVLSNRFRLIESVPRARAQHYSSAFYLEFRDMVRV